MSDNTTTEAMAALIDAVDHTTGDIVATLPDGTYSVMWGYRSSDRQWLRLDCEYRSPKDVSLCMCREELKLFVESERLDTHGWRCWGAGIEFKIEIPSYGTITLTCNGVVPPLRAPNVTPNVTPPVVQERPVPLRNKTMKSIKTIVGALCCLVGIYLLGAVVIDLVRW